jgi:hypothetical protein
MMASLNGSGLRAIWSILRQGLAALAIYSLVALSLL